MIPSGYKEDTVFSAIPTDGSGDLSFTRASNGTRVNSAGLVEVCPWNLLTYSSVLSDSSYNIGEVTASYSQTDPNGGTTGALFTGVSATNAFIIKPFTTIIGQVYTCFVYLKGNSSGSVSLRAQGATTAPVNNVNYTTSYQQFTYTFTADSTTTNLIIGGFGSWTGSEAIYVAFPQANIGATAKPYFPTTDRLNVPRLTYQNGGGGCPSLLLEKQSTNVILYSEQFDNAAWSKSNVTITANNTTSPDGTQNADLSTATAGGELLQGVVLSTSTSYTFSFYVKKGTASDAKYRVYNFDAGVNVVAPTSYISQTSTSDWVRVVVSFTTGATGTNYGIYLLDQTSAGTMYFWGAQLEASSYVTSLIPTTSASATRVADVAQKTGISSLIGQTEGVIYWEGIIPVRNESGFASNSTSLINSARNVNTNSGFSIQYIETTNSVNALLFVGDGTVNPKISLAASSLAIGTYVKIAFAYKSGDSALYVNGNLSQSSNNTFTSSTSISEIWLNDLNVYFGYPSSGTVNEVILFPTRLTNAELASLTTI
jgi:hypothetical protein